MAVREARASGLEFLALATVLLQRARRADAEAGLWEAADLQWWWRTPRRSDAIEHLFWIDAEGPAAGVVLTDWGRVRRGGLPGDFYEQVIQLGEASRDH